MQDERGSDVLIFLVGNKSDAVDDRKITIEDGLDKGKNMKFSFEEVSAKSGDNI